MATIKLKDFEALVLIEFLMRFSDDDNLSIEHKAEEEMLHDLCAELESQVSELLDPNYEKLLDDARKKMVKGDHY